ncbi:TPA: restriction endonuclease subunit S [Streptococcus suis]
MSEVKLGDIGKISMCKRILKSQTNEVSGIPFYKISTFGGIADVFIDEAIFHEYKEKYSYPKKGDILISAAGTVGKTVIYTGEDAYFQDSNIVWIDNNEKIVTNQYLYYFYQTNPFVSTNGSTIKRLYNDNIRETKIKNVPSIEAQNKVTKVLEYLDQKIAINNQINEELEAMAKTLYDYWFVQFDFPDENGKPYKSSGGKMVYNDQLKREIPEGWGVKLLGELSTYVTDKISSNDLNSKNYIGTDNMLSNMKGIEQATYLPNSTLVNSFIPNDILIANIRPYFKKIWISDRTGGCSSDVLCLRANDKEICNYLFYSLARDDFFNYNVTGSKGSKMPRGDKAHIQKYSVLFSEKHALKFSKLVSNFISQKHLIYKQNQELSQLRDWLLPMLMNGQVKVE